jgi:hypothetical protein
MNKKMIEQMISKTYIPEFRMSIKKAGVDRPFEFVNLGGVEPPTF